MVHFLPRQRVTHVLLGFDHRWRSEHFEATEIDNQNYSVESRRQEFERYAH